MPRLHVCSLALIAETVAKTGARSLVTLLSPGTEVERPIANEAERHLYLAVSDIVEPMPGQVLPDATHLDELLGFVRAWDRAEPMLIHCFAGVSRSTAAAYIAACALAPGATSSPLPARCAQLLRPLRPTPASWRSPTTRSAAGPDERSDRRHWPRRGMLRRDAVHGRTGVTAAEGAYSVARTFARWASRRSSSRSIRLRGSSFSSPSR